MDTTKEINKDIATIGGRFNETTVKSSEMTADITHANADAEVVEVSDTHSLDLLKFNASLHHQEDQSVISFLSRPQIISYGNLASTGSWPNFIYASLFPSTFNAIPIVADKLSGIWGMRCDFVFTLSVNAQRFQQGRYILAWMPLAGSLKPSDGTGGFNIFTNHVASRTQITQLPHVEIDINCETEVSLRVPYVSALPYTPTRPSNIRAFQQGAIYFVPYSAIKAGPSSYNCDYVLSVRAENIKLAGPVVPQSSRPKGYVKRDVEAQEQNSAGVGPVATTLRLASDVAGIFKRVPMLSSVAEPAQWWLELTSNVANAFGWSRPHNSEHNCLMLKNNMGQMTNVDTVDNSEVLGYTDKNHIEVLPGFSGSDVDELSIRYLSGISAWYNTLVWNATDGENTIIHSKDMQPKNFFSTGTYGAYTTFNLTPMAFVSSFFAYYRGSIKLTFKFVKTEFHSGRLLLTFTPTDTLIPAASPTTFQDSAYTFREIIDIRKGSVFSFVIPFTSFSQYRPTIGTDSYYGQIQLRVLNDLRAPDTCSQSIDILAEASAHTDMEFMMPATCRGRMVVVPGPQSGSKKITMDLPQCDTEAVVMGNAVIEETDWPSRACVGEKIVSLRQVLKRQSLLEKVTPGNPADGGYLMFNPYTIPFDVIDNTATLERQNVISDNYAKISSCFALLRGGVRFKLVHTRPITDSAYWLSSAFFLSVDEGTYNTFLDYSPTAAGINDISETSNNSVAIDRQESRGGIELQFPYYSPVYASPVKDFILTSESQLTRSMVVPSTYAYVLNNGTALTSDYRTYRAASDDFDLGMFISVPPIIGWGFTGGA